jgi:hypothetical protein
MTLPVYDDIRAELDAFIDPQEPKVPNRLVIHVTLYDTPMPPLGTKTDLQ